MAHNIMGYEANLRHLKAAVELLANKSPSSTFMVGGTCASEIAPVSYLNQYYSGDLAVLWFDAHGDLNSPESSPSKHFHGMPLRTLLGGGEQEVSNLMFSQLKPEQVFVLGGRDLDQPEQAYVAEAGLTLLTPEQLKAVDSLIQSIRDRGFKHLYVHVDLDVLEPTDFPHMLLPIDNGVLVSHLQGILAALAQSFEIVGSSIVEYVPKDESGLTALDQILALIRKE